MTAQPSAAEEVAGLDKVLLRLGLTEEWTWRRYGYGTRVALVLGSHGWDQTVRAMIVQARQHDSTTYNIAPASWCFGSVRVAGVLEILAHVNKRLKGAPACQLPSRRCWTCSVSRVGLEQPGAAEARLPGVKAAGGGCSCDPAALAVYPFLGNLVDRQAFLGYALKLLQYGPKPSASRATTALAAAQAVLATADRAGQLPAGEVLVRRKMGVLNLLAGAGLPGRELLLPCLVAACDSADQVARRGEEMLKRQCSHEGNKPQVDLEADTQLLHALYALFLGTVASEQAGAAVAGGVVSGGALLTDIAGVAAPSTGAQTRPDAIVQPASVPVRCRVLGLLCRSVAAASLFPATLLTIQEAALNTRRGAAFGFAGIAKLAGEQLQPHVQQLVPKLYRYQYDPNPRVQESMAAVWKGLVDDPKAAVDAAFPAIMADLLKELGGRLWRSRQAAAAAMADLLQGRRWVELQGHLAQVWTMTFRAMDDIKDSVRRAAAGLARSLRGVTLRLCDPSLSPPRDAQAAVGLVLPLMLDQGITSSVEEVCPARGSVLTGGHAVSGGAGWGLPLTP
ncbi:hypothetical protein QJQ45_018491 [Haematococcus lacustris]|nr:hypothetical protein QJQ45_018491 [Haematococcus lacustris]